MENRVYDYLQGILSQLRDIYTTKTQTLRANYLELEKKQTLIGYNHHFIQKSHDLLDRIDFLN